MESAVQTLPDAQAQKKQLRKALEPGLKTLIQNDVDNSVDPEKVFQYAELRRNEYYWRGKQYLDEQQDAQGRTTDYSPINGSVLEKQGQRVDLYDSVVNDVRGLGRKFIAVCSQQPPNVKAVANDRMNASHVERAAKADRVFQIWRSLVNIANANRKLFLTFYKNGPAFGYTPFVADSDKYGEADVPVIENQMMPSGSPMLTCVGCGESTPVDDPSQAPMACPNCGKPFGPEDYKDPEQIPVPVQTGTKTYPNGCAEHIQLSGMQVTTPFDIDGVRGTPWLEYEYEEHQGKLISAYPELADRLGGDSASETSAGTTSTQQGRTTRELASSPSGTYLTARRSRWIYKRIWLRPSMYNLARTEIKPESVGLQPSQDGRPVKMGGILRQLFPKGLRVTMVNEWLVDLEEEKIDDVWTMASPEPAETAYCDPLCTDVIDAQDLTNDTYNIIKQTLERMIPMTAIDANIIDIDAYAKFRHLPAEFVPVKRGQGSLGDCMANIPTAKPDIFLAEYPPRIREHAAEIIGITPQIYGGGGTENTAYATNLKRNQAMLQLSMAMDAGREYWARVGQNAVMQIARYSGGRIPSQHDPSGEYIEIDNIEDLLQGGWHFETSDAMPMAWSERRAQMMDLLEKFGGNPQLFQIFNFMDPENIEVFQDEIMGMPDWKVQNQDAIEKLHEEIRELLQGEPVQQEGPPNPDGSPGQPVEIPSIPVDDFEDNHQFVADAVKAWSQTADARLVRRDNPKGYSNVIAFGKAHAGLAQQAMIPPTGPPAPGGSPPPEGPAGGPPQGGPGGMQPPSAPPQPGM